MKDAAQGPVIQRVRHELKRRELTVAAVEPLGPGFVAITFTGDELGDFVSASFDDHVKLMFDESAETPVRRDYTPRRFDREQRTLTLEFALHGHGAASEWARSAQAGQRLTVGGPRGSFVVPLALDWHLLVGDTTALPAISRRLEELPAGARAVVVAMADAADRRDLPTQADAEIIWVDNADALVAALQAWTPPAGQGVAWGGGEAQAMARVRRILDEKGVPRELTRVSAYWKRGVADHHETLE
ncbi:siderophore-interacting protein [Herbaspirillum sp. SJZ107]|uniref:siderophore-interacting protein n=1 Tax=Herbaspirillum sp. SJZ107 TaxID=2572881 RepID=UPI001150F375|nr:siderophore-interacting protein [Herbaspirillum sp. SJZ107]TQK11009.1 NADPH-dependent ferric siderophore reductase [Herbaspirillum sp. SJZ107]